jgi:hypothetical protein
MAESLSIAASIIAVIQITGRVVSLCYDYRAGLKTHQNDIKQINDEITSVRNVLESILRLIDNEEEGPSQLSTLRLLTQPDGVLSSCKTEMLSLEKDLKPATGSRAIVRKLKWPYTRGEIKKKVEKLGWVKSSLSLAIVADQT